jgi:hypothetical protein
MQQIAFGIAASFCLMALQTQACLDETENLSRKAG